MLPTKTTTRIGLNDRRTKDSHATSSQTIDQLMLEQKTVVTNNVIQRVFHVRNEKGGMATAFAFDHKNRQYLVTARHVAKDNIKSVFHSDIWEPLKLKTVGHAEGEVDITVFAPESQIVPIGN